MTKSRTLFCPRTVVQPNRRKHVLLHPTSNWQMKTKHYRRQAQTNSDSPDSGSGMVCTMVRNPLNMSRAQSI